MGNPLKVKENSLYILGSIIQDNVYRIKSLNWFLAEDLRPIFVLKLRDQLKKKKEKGEELKDYTFFKTDKLVWKMVTLTERLTDRE